MPRWPDWRLTDAQRDLAAAWPKLIGWGMRTTLAAYPGLRRRRDLVQSACHMALCHAARSHDPSKGSPFPHWFYCKLRGEISGLRKALRPLGYRGDPAGAPGVVDLDPEALDRRWGYRGPDG